MQELDSDESVESWDYEPLSIPYAFEERRRRYIPDFLIRMRSGGVFLEEVGPKPLKGSSERNLCKEEAARAYCAVRGFTYRIWQPTST